MDVETESKGEWSRRGTVVLLSALNIGLGVYVIIFVLPIFYRRLMFPGVLEFQESMTIFLLHRMSQGIGNLYEMPSLYSGSVIYNPAYYFYLWLFEPILGNQSVPIRLASVVPPLLLCAVLIELIGRKHFQLRWLGVAWAFISLAVYPLVTWIDLARLEAMVLLSIVLVWYTLCLDDDWWPKWIWVGLAVAFSFSVKQPGALFAAAPLALAITDRRYLISVAVAITSIAAFVGAMYALYGEPYIYWAFTEPGAHEFSFVNAIDYLQTVVGVAPVILFSPLLLLASGFDMRSAAGKLILVTAVTFAISAMGAGKIGGSAAQYVILLFVATIPAGIFINQARRAPEWSNMRFSLVTFLVLAYSMVTTWTNDFRGQVRPRALDAQQQAALLDIVRNVPGKTWVSTWTHIDLWARGEMNTPIRVAVHEQASKATEAAIRNRDFSLVVTSPECDTWFERLVREHYVHCCSLPMRHFRARMFLPTEVWARSEAEKELVLQAVRK